MTYLRDGCVGKCNSQSFLSGCGVSPYVHAEQYMCMPQAMGPTRTGKEGSNIVRGEGLSGGGRGRSTTPPPTLHPENLSQDPFP